MVHIVNQHLHYNTHDRYDENFALDEIDACIVKINIIEVVDVDDPWYLNSGVIYHISKNQKIFTSLEPTHGNTIKLTYGHNHMIYNVDNVIISFFPR